MTLPLLHGPDVRASRLDARDLAALRALCERCSAFFEMVYGRPGMPRVAEEILTSLAPGRTEREKHLLGFWREAELLAVVDLCEDYPAAQAWYVALFLVTPASRQHGLGTLIWTAVEEWIRGRHGTRTTLIVQQENAAARRFWEARGFAVAGETTQTVDGHVHNVWTLVKGTAG